MKIFKTKSDVDNLRELHQRKAELRARVDAEKAELQLAWQKVRTDVEPAKIAADVAQSLLGLSDTNSSASRLNGPLRLAADLFIGSARTRLLLKLVTPLVLTYLPQLTQKAKNFSLKETKPKIYGALRKGIAGLRSQLRRKKTAGTPDPETAPHR